MTEILHEILKPETKLIVKASKSLEDEIKQELTMEDPEEEECTELKDCPKTKS